MSIFNRENFNFGWTSYYKRIPKGEDIPISIGDGIQIETIYSGNEPVEVRLSVPEKDEPEVYHEPMKRFRVCDKWLHETLEQSDTNDYSYRDRENMWICDITDAFEDPVRFVVQENTEIKDIRNRYIFAGDQVGFTAEVFGVTAYRKGTVVRGDTGMWQVMVDETIPFGLYHIKDRVILGHINEGV